VFDKIYLGPFASDKIALMMELINRMDFKNNLLEVEKVSLSDYLKQHQAAYQEISNIGLVKEF
jgi:hypothetical protein